MHELLERFDEAEQLIQTRREALKNNFIALPEITLGDYARQANETPISFDTFQEGVRWSDQYPTNAPKDMYCALGLTGEAGEAAEVIKKLYRNNDGKITEEIKDKLVKELGDVLWYMASLANCHGIKLSDIAKTNQVKLVDRLRRGKIRSSGDNR